MMELLFLKVLLNSISSFLSLSSLASLDSEPVQKYYQKVAEILMVLKPILNVVVDMEVPLDKLLEKKSEELGQLIDELWELFKTYHPLMSKVYLVLQIESLILKIRASSLEILLLLESQQQSLPAELTPASLEPCIQKIKVTGYEQTTKILKEAMRDQVDSAIPSPENLGDIADSLNLKSNQELLIEAVALDKLKEDAEQAEDNAAAEYIDKLICLVTHMHERFIILKQSQSSSPVTIPPDFCCPLSLELMTDPVIVASGQTYERAFIRNWIDLGLTVCPKTRQTLSHANLIPNYTVKALIASWCECNNVKLPDPMRATSLNQHLPLINPVESVSPRDPQVFHTRPNQPRTPDSIWSMGLPGDSVVSPTGEGAALSHPQSSSDVSLSAVGNGHALDMGRISLTSSEDEMTNSAERSADSGRQSSESKSRNESSPDGIDDQSFQSHKQTSSGSSSVSRVDLLPGTQGNANKESHTSDSLSYSGDATGKVAPEPQGAAASLTAPQREPQYPLRLEIRSRSHTMWRRPSQRFVPRITSNPGLETRADLLGIETEVRKLVDDLNNTSIDTQRDATAELRLLAKHNMDNRIVIANCGAIPLLVNLLHSTDPKTQENAVTALLNLSINDNNKTEIANAKAIEPLIHVLREGTPEAKENAAATLFSLSVIEDNKIMIGRSGAVEPLVDLLGNGTPRGKKDAATALFNLSIYHENKSRIVQAGAVKHLVELMDPSAGMVDKAVAVMANLATIPEGRVEIGQEGGIPVLVEVVELGSARGKENAAAALLQLCTHSGRFCNMVLQEGAVPPLVALSQSGTPRAKEKAQALLNCFRNQRHGNPGRG